MSTCGTPRKPATPTGKLIQFSDRGYHMAEMLFETHLTRNEIVLVKSLAESCISPNLWMAKYATSNAIGNSRPDTSMRNTAISRRRYRDNFGVKLWMIDAFVRQVMLKPSKVATTWERLLVLPRALEAIRDGSMRVVLLPHRSHDPIMGQVTWVRSRYQELVSEYERDHRIDALDHRGSYIFDDSRDFTERFDTYLSRVRQYYDVECRTRSLTQTLRYERSKQTVLEMLEILRREIEAGELPADPGVGTDEWLALIDATVHAMEAGDRYVTHPDSGEVLAFEEQTEDDYSGVNDDEWSHRVSKWADNTIRLNEGASSLKQSLIEVFKLRSDCNATHKGLFDHSESLFKALIDDDLSPGTRSGLESVAHILYAALYDCAGGQSLRYPANLPQSYVFTVKYVRNYFSHDKNKLNKKQVETAEGYFRRHSSWPDPKDQRCSDLERLDLQTALLDDAKTFLKECLSAGNAASTSASPIPLAT